MGLANARIQLRNPKLTDLEPVEVDALADTGSVHLCIPSHVVHLQSEHLRVIPRQGAPLASAQQGLRTVGG